MVVGVAAVLVMLVAIEGDPLGMKRVVLEATGASSFRVVVEVASFASSALLLGLRVTKVVLAGVVTVTTAASVSVSFAKVSSDTVEGHSAGVSVAFSIEAVSVSIASGVVVVVSAPACTSPRRFRKTRLFSISGRGRKVLGMPKSGLRVGVSSALSNDSSGTTCRGMGCEESGSRCSRRGCELAML